MKRWEEMFTWFKLVFKEELQRFKLIAVMRGQPTYREFQFSSWDVIETWMTCSKSLKDKYDFTWDKSLSFQKIISTKDFVWIKRSLQREETEIMNVAAHPHAVWSMKLHSVQFCFLYFFMKCSMSKMTVSLCHWCYVCMWLLRPHVVTVQWLLDSFSKGSLLPEEGYLHPHCLPPAGPAVSMPTHHPPKSRPSAGPPIFSPKTPKGKTAEEDLLSQYMDDDPTVGKRLSLLPLLSPE